MGMDQLIQEEGTDGAEGPRQNPGEHSLKGRALKEKPVKETEDWPETWVENVGCHIDQEEYFKKEGVASWVEFLRGLAK